MDLTNVMSPYFVYGLSALMTAREGQGNPPSAIPFLRFLCEILCTSDNAIINRFRIFSILILVIIPYMR